MLDFEKMKTIMGIFGPMFGVIGKIGNWLKPTPSVDNSHSSNASGVQVRQGNNGTIRFDGSPITINSAPEPQWVPQPRWHVRCLSGGGTRGNLRCDFEVTNMGGRAYEVVVEERGCNFRQEFPPVGERGNVRFQVKFSTGLPPSLIFLISALDANGKPVRVRVLGTVDGVRYVFEPFEVAQS